MQPINFDPTTFAFVVIDLQKGIVSYPSAPHEASAVVANAAALAAAFRAKGSLVFLVRVTPSSDGKDALKPLVDAPMQRGSMQADWAEIVPELGPKAGDLVITKRQWGAFYGTELDMQLRRRGIRTIVLCGISTNIGVESTARGAYELGYDQVLVEDAMTARSVEEHEMSCNVIFPRLGLVRKTAEVLAAIG